MNNKLLFNEREMKKIFTLPEDYFKKYGEIFQCPNGSFYIYKKNRSKVLAIAHLDFVGIENYFRFINFPNGEKLIFSPALDDRLGAYIILYILPLLGLNVDILLTTGEEIGQSTAQYLKTDEKYNWMISFDRSGDDIVLYQYIHDKNWKNAVESIGKKSKIYQRDISYGLYSDICKLGFLNICGLNIGTGYIDNHSYFCHAKFSDVIDSVNWFKKFYKKYYHTKFIHSPAYDYYLDDYDLWRANGERYDYSNGIYSKSSQYKSCYYCGQSLMFKDEIETGYCYQCKEIEGI